MQVNNDIRGALQKAADAAEWSYLRSTRHAREILRRGRRQEPAPTPWVRATVLGAGAGLATGMTLTALASAVAGYFARVVVTPVKERVEDLEILAVVRGSHGEDVILPATPETVIDGVYGLYFNGGRGFARIGAITSFTPRDGTISRRVEAVQGGDLSKAVRGWWSSVAFQTPEAAGVQSQDVVLNLPGGPAPAWYVPAGSSANGSAPDSVIPDSVTLDSVTLDSAAADSQAPLAGRGIWAIMVHGRGGSRTEGIKALPAAQKLGIDSLLMSYRNDGEAPAAPDGRYGLGVTEWEDVEVGIQYALDHGARSIVLFGWSMGGAICLQTTDRSPLATHVRGLVLTGPVIDWIDVLAYQARALKIPKLVGRLTRWFISNKAGRRFTGLASPVDLRILNWIDRADQLHVRTLILHSRDDDVVPYGPSRDLAQHNPMVAFVPFARAKHVKEWNHSPQRWERHVTQWLTDLYNQPEPGQEATAQGQLHESQPSAAE